MKTIFYSLILVVLLPFITGSTIHPTEHHSANKSPYRNSIDEKGTFLMYIGNVGDVLVDLQVEMVPSIGIQYSVSLSRGDKKNFLSHIAIFYKLSKPEEAVYYNYLTHTTKILPASESSGDDGTPKVTAVGKETIKKYPCTHLVNKSENRTEEYWMSTKVPGFDTFVKKLYKADPNLVLMDINGTIFNWGGLVKLKWTNKNGQAGNIELTEASIDTPIPASDFDPPKK